MQPKLLLRYIFVVLALLFAVLGIVPSSYAWLSGWNQRIELTTDHTVIDATLSNFPVYVKLSTSSGKTPTDVSAVFDEVGANWQKIAIANSSDTECYVEKVSWDGTGETAELHIKLVSISNSADGNWYLYYDNDHADNTVYVKGVGDATDVWDSNFVMVLHMNEDPSVAAPQMIDSTSNNNDGTSGGSMTSGDLVDGKIGKALNFDGLDNYVDCGTNESLDITDVLTIEAWIKPTDSNDNFIAILQRQQASNSDVDSYYFGFNLDYKLQFGTFGGNSQSTQTIWNNGQQYHVVGTYSSTGPTGKMYIDGVEETLSVDNVDTMVGGANELHIAHFKTLYFNGLIDEVHISNIDRSADWIKASYYSEDDNLLTFGSEETQGGLVTPFGLGVDIFEVIQ